MSFYTQFAETYESIFPFSAAVYGFLRRHLPLAPALVLDVGCGTGHYAGPLSQDGYTATAVDLDPAMIDYARAHYPVVDFHVMNMLDVGTLDQSFDGVSCIGNTAAHLTQTQFGEFTGAVRDVLAPGGPFILQVMNWDHVLTQTSVTFPVIEGAGDAVFYRAYRDISETQVTFATRLEVRGETVFEGAVPLYPVRSAEIAAVAAEHGLKLVEHVGSYGGSPFDAEVFSANVMVFE
ncbi:MAG: methyltransferase domain-containing protein [Anaerolineae bacterium]|nr:methyltransferase domain-containing protein [Anaerolineae bacterium]